LDVYLWEKRAKVGGKKNKKEKREEATKRGKYEEVTVIRKWHHDRWRRWNRGHQRQGRA
jgi:hypothetical protein